MKGKLKIAIALVVGLFLGASGMFVFMGINTQKVMAIYADAQLFEMAVNAALLRAGRGEDLLRRYDMAIPRNAVAFAEYHRRYTKSHMPLWSVQTYYERHPSVRVPAEIKPILDALPPRPLSSCELNRAAAGEAAPPEERSSTDLENAAQQP